MRRLETILHEEKLVQLAMFTPPKTMLKRWNLEAVLTRYFMKVGQELLFVDCRGQSWHPRFQGTWLGKEGTLVTAHIPLCSQCLPRS